MFHFVADPRGNIYRVSAGVPFEVDTGSSDIPVSYTGPGNAVFWFDTTGGLCLPAGDVAQRPAAPPTGTLRMNIDPARTAAPEVFDGTDWRAVITSNTDSSLIYAIIFG
jgi:hypothetical protein